MRSVDRVMQKAALLLLLSLHSTWAQAGLSALFKDEQGRTNWQHLANWVSGTLIILLTIVVVFLFRASRRAYHANRELKAIQSQLELRVQERTATLDESNRLLKQEVECHVETSGKLRESESYIRDILTSMPLMLVGLDREGRVTQWNREAADASGISEEKALGRLLWDVYPTATIAPEQLQQALVQEKTIHLRQSLGGASHYDITISPLKSRLSPGVVVLIDDVSRQTTAENLLIQNDKLSFMGELASSMAHDINLPLQGILLDLKSFQSLLSETLVNGEGAVAGSPVRLKEILADIAEKGDHVSNIINNLIAFARNRHNNRQRADLIDVMENTINLANDVISVPELSFNQILLERDFDEELPSVPCYVTELQQVFLSLFRHATTSLAQKLAPDFRPQIKVTLREEYDNCWIRIQHNGVTLSAEEQMYLFEPFFSDTTQKESIDAGQRLSFSYYIVTEQHTGHMAVTSDLEQGTTFHIQLPLLDC